MNVLGDYTSKLYYCDGGLYHSNTDAGRFWEVVCMPRRRGGRGITRDGADYCVEGNSLREKDSAIPPSEE